jgi:hypothetical protein
MATNLTVAHSPWGDDGQVGDLGRSGYLLLGSAATVVVANAVLGAPCGLRVATGHFCALCGGTRAFHAVLDGELLVAVRMNAVATVAMILLAAAAAAALGAPTARMKVDQALAWILDLGAGRIALAIASWTLVRNLPGLELLRPPA